LTGGHPLETIAGHAPVPGVAVDLEAPRPAPAEWMQPGLRPVSAMPTVPAGRSIHYGNGLADPASYPW